MDEITRRVSAYILHDPVGNIEGYINEYDASKLQDAEDGGMVVIAEYNDGLRERVKASDVVQPQPEMKGVTLVQPRYVDERMQAVVGVFDALADGMAPSPMALTVDDAAITFAQALAALKSIVYEGAEGR